MAINTHQFSGTSVINALYKANNNFEATKFFDVTGQYTFAFTGTYDDVTRRLTIPKMTVNLTASRGTLDVTEGNNLLVRPRFKIFVRGVNAVGTPVPSYFTGVVYATSDYSSNKDLPLTNVEVVPYGFSGHFDFPSSIQSIEFYALIYGDEQVFNAPYYSKFNTSKLLHPANGGTLDLSEGKPRGSSADYLGLLSFNRVPTNTTIPSQSTQLGVNKTVNLASYFSDADGDSLAYSASSSSTVVSTVSISGSTLTLRPVALGSTTITVTANDGKGGTKSTTFTFSVTNSAPTVNLTTPTANQTLYENDVFSIAGTVTDVDSGNSVTVRYQINANTVRAIKAFVSDGTTLEAFSKSLRFSGGSLYDGETLIASGLTDGVAHTLKVYATDDQGGQSVIVERDFYVVPNRAPSLTVTPPVIDGVIDSDTFTIAGTYADADKNETVISYRINGSASKEVARGTSGTFDFTLSLSQLTVGQNTIVVDALDSYGAKTSRTIKLNKNTIATPLLQSTVRYLVQPPKGSAQAVLLWLQRDQDLAVTASLHMGMKGEAEAFTLLEPTNTAPLRDNATILEDEFYHEADSAKDHIILQLDMKRSSVESTAAIHLISGVFE